MKSHPFRSPRVLLFVGPVALLLLVLASIIAIRGPFNAHASGTLKLYVGHTQGLNTGCASPGFTSVQAAVDVANTNNIVYLCGTTPYYEQVVIQKTITLTGDPGATIAAPNPFPSTSPTRLPPQFTTDNLFIPQAIIFVWGSSAKVNIRNLIIAGPLPGNGGCAEQEFGVLVLDNGTANLTGDQVKDIHDSNSSLYGCQFGIGIQVGREYWPSADFSTFKQENFVGHASIKTTAVNGYQKNGITVDGPGSTSYLSADTVTGDGLNNGKLFSSITAQNGIQISRGAKGQLFGNTVTDNTYTGPGGASAGGILIYGGPCDGPATPLTTGIQIKNNIVQNNDVGVYLFNMIVDSNNNCALPPTPTSNIVYNNQITNNAVSNTSGPNLLNAPGGYQTGISDVGNADHLISNKICGVGYTPLATPPPYLSRIDVLAIDPIVNGNTVCTSSQPVTPSAQPQKSLHGQRHTMHSPVK